ncbi:Malto-oligosyltrehalose synthase [Sandaracinus amylolyticus]|uniref:Malto-oligosyltrehalose synthase n=2 Tax=Sandaracinus amylolyticus TaxID=927083 RepID=A0A0F6W4P9_9BACT|nr:Malto-oligosyltrehalose synthase [Sandaracinus amylolyticus]
MRVPLSTYRIQLRQGVDLRAARALLDYLEALGVTDVYLSPILEAEPESTHGYDVVSHERIDPVLGGERDLEALARDAHARGMGVIVDFVPNHVSVASDRNALWQDLLTYGRGSSAASVFDVEWSPPRIGLEGRILLPVLGDMYGRVLEKGELRLARHGGHVRLDYWERALPLAPSTLAPVVASAVERLPEIDPSRARLAKIARALAELPGPREADPEAARRARELDRALAEAIEDDAQIAGAIDAAVAEYNGSPGDPASFDALHAMIEQQVYRPSAWRLALESINYRRFFDVDHLAAIRMERPEVFDAAHRTLLSWIGRGLVDGVRLDHTDGLADPAGYFVALQEGAARARGEDGRAIWVVAEKILAQHEKLPSGWAIDGTTGYETARIFTGVLVDPRGVARNLAFYRRFTGDGLSFEEHSYVSKRMVLRTTFASEVRALADDLERLAAADRQWCDLTPSALTVALEETIAAFPTYRSYVRPDGARERDDDALINRALRRARKRSPERVADAFDFLEQLLMDPSLEPGGTRAHLVMRFQQLTGPATAKAIEDTAFYRYVPFLAANEVGAEPGAPAVSVEDFHRANLERLERWPASMTTTSTHDAKRGEDARARLAVLAERPDVWRHAVTRWSRAHADKRTQLEDGSVAPVPRDEMLVYQALVGAWPHVREERAAVRDRMLGFVEKALREAKELSSWIRPDAEYEGATKRFVERLLEDASFVAELEGLLATMRSAAISNSLAQVVLRTASPGVPDLYQGSEAWNLSLVDPDNRRPVAFDTLREALTELRGARDPEALAEALLGAPEDGRVKLWVTHRALDARRRERELYLRGAYVALTGDEHTVAFARVLDERVHLAITTRLPFALAGESAPIGEAWGERRVRGDALADGMRFADVLTGRTHQAQDGLRLADVLAVLPCAVLERVGS